MQWFFRPLPQGLINLFDYLIIWGLGRSPKKIVSHTKRPMLFI